MANRIIAPWTTHAAMSETDRRRLLCVLDYVRAAHLTRACWIWPERREPVPIEAPDISRWLTHWAAGRTSYVAAAERPVACRPASNIGRHRASA
jgi:hypothetical protein